MTCRIEQLHADEAQPFGPQFGPDTDQPRRRRTVVARSGGSIIGACSATWSTWHPDFGFADIVVAPEHQRRGVARQLLHGLEERADGALMFNAEPAVPGLSEFLTAVGYVPVTSSRTVRYEIPSALDAALVEALPHDVVVAQEPMTPEVAQLFEVVYAEHHDWAGTYESMPGRTWIAHAGEPIPAGLFVARNDASPIAAVCPVIGAFADGSDAFIPPFGVVRDAPPTNTAGVVGHLLRSSLEGLRDGGAGTVLIECDSTYNDLAAVLSSLDGTVVHDPVCWQRPVG